MLRKTFKGLGLFLLLAICAFFLWPQKKYKPHEVSADFQAQVDSFNLPDMPADWSWEFFTAKDGTKLRWGETGNSGAAKASVLIIPGYTATLRMYGEQVDDLARRGYHVIGIDLRGQGGSERHDPKQPEKLWAKDFSVYSNDVAEFIQSLPQTGRPFIPIASSFGGHVALRMVGDHAGIVDGLYLLAPAIEPAAGNMSFGQALGFMKLGRSLGKGNRYLTGSDNWSPFQEDLSVANIDMCSSDSTRLPARDVVFTRYPEERVGGITYQYGSTFFESSLYIRGDGYLETIDVPMTMVSAQVDHFVMTEVNQKSCDSRFPDCQRLDIAGAGHCLFQESNNMLAQMYDGLDELLERVVKLTLD